MTTITVERLRKDGPFHVGDRCDVAAPDADEHLHDVIRKVVPTGPNHVNVTVELEEEPPRPPSVPNWAAAERAGGACVVVTRFRTPPLLSQQLARRPLVAYAGSHAAAGINNVAGHALCRLRCVA